MIVNDSEDDDDDNDGHNDDGSSIGSKQIRSSSPEAKGTVEDSKDYENGEKGSERLDINRSAVGTVNDPICTSPLCKCLPFALHARFL